MTTSPPSPSAPVPNANHGETIARTLLERAPVLVYVVDLNFKVVLMNRELRDVSGWDTSSCGDIENLLANFYPDPDYRGPIRAIHDGWANTPSEQIRDTVMVLTTAAGQQRSISWTTARLRVGQEPVRGYIALGVDVSTRRNLEHWVTLFQQSLLQMNEALALVDPNGNILAWSAGATALLGHTEADTQGRSLHSLLDNAGDDTASQALTVALATETPSPFSAELRRDDGSAQLLELEVNRIADPSGKLLAHLVQMSGPSQVEVDTGALEEAELQAKDASAAAEEAKNALASALEEAEGAAEEAKGLLAAAEKDADSARTTLAAAETRLDLAEEAADALRTELEENQSQWSVERAELVRSHVADRDALVESSAEERAAFIKRIDGERAELEEQLRNDILAAEERAEGQLESQEQVHKQARAEWDDAMAISGHEMASRMSAVTEKISQILIEGSDPSGNLPAAAISALARLIGRPELILADSEDAASSDFDLSADDLILDDEGEDAIDAPPPVSPAMVATASELEAHVPRGSDEGESELDLDPSSELDLEPVSELDLDLGSDLDLEPISELDVAPIPGLDEVDVEDDDLDLDDEEGGSDEEVGRDLAQEPTEEDLASSSESESQSEPSSSKSDDSA